MAKHLSHRDVEVIVNMIRGWQAPLLTWEAMCDAATRLIGKRPSRQSLTRHEPIHQAYLARKAQLRMAPAPGKALPADISAQRVVHLSAELAALKAEQHALLARFVVWQYNAYKHGLTEHQLNEPLPVIDREVT